VFLVKCLLLDALRDALDATLGELILLLDFIFTKSNFKYQCASFPLTSEIVTIFLNICCSFSFFRFVAKEEERVKNPNVNYAELSPEDFGNQLVWDRLVDLIRNEGSFQ
jgi:hypothetical protein